MADADSTEGVADGGTVTVGQDGEGFPHGSRYPILVAIGLGLAGVGLVRPAVLLPGAIVFVVGVAGWVYEYAVVDFERGIVPAQKRELLGTNSGMVAMSLVILSEIVVFGGLFATFFALKAQSGPWPPAGLPGLDVWYALGLTVVLVSSGVTMHWAEAAIARGDRRRFGLGLALTFVLGGLFVVGQAVEYLEMMSEGMTPTAGPYGAAFYALTGTHGAHVAAGLVLIGIVALRAGVRGHFDAERHLMVRATTVYWHFVDAVWLFIVAFVYMGVGS